MRQYGGGGQRGKHDWEATTYRNQGLGLMMGFCKVLDGHASVSVRKTTTCRYKKKERDWIKTRGIGTKGKC